MKVLTTRVAHLILHHNISPSSICAVTFTNKAAKEMRERLKKLIGKDGVAQLKMGTFHALCAKFLRVYAELIGLAGNFTVCDADESKKILRKLLEPHKEFLAERNLTLKEATVATLISQAKAKGHNAADYLYDITHTYKVHPVAVVKPDDIKLVVAEIFKEYEQLLRHTNCLDFDDLLVFGVQLFREHSRVVSWCRHVLVDEFQDTNIMQYDLMKYLATAHECVTIVGDPDQSIYGWRSAEVKNLGKMQDDFYETRQILLEQNYRSTGSILSASIAIVSQDKRRIVKRLLSTHSKGVTPLLDEHSSELDQAINIATEIKRIVAYTGGMLGYNDFVILLRFNALSRTLEQALQKSGIPCRVLAGHKFFERLEIKDLLAYLQVVDNPKFIPAFSRIINVPGRGIGEKTLKGVLAKATAMKLTPMEVIEGIYDGEISDIKPPVKRKVGSFVKAIRTLRKLDNDDTPPPELIRRLIDLVQYEDHLKKTQQDWETRWENVQELINFASEVETDMSFDRVMEDLEKRVGGEVDWQDEGRALEEMELDEVGFVVDDGRTKGKDKGKEKAQSEKRDNVTTPLRAFLEASMLSTDVEDQNGESKDIKEVKEKVTIATCHAAKGLEWPVVFVPSVEKGIFPFSRSEDVDEERRLLYVACTRAQGLLALSYCSERMVAGEKKATELSHFILRVLKEAPVSVSPLSVNYTKFPETGDTRLNTIDRVLSRPSHLNWIIPRLLNWRKSFADRPRLKLMLRPRLKNINANYKLPQILSPVLSQLKDGNALRRSSLKARSSGQAICFKSPSPINLL
ncbi:hypothetical protein JAAARDRAFT_655375 [Jaapia argillacea MUCL 33604]|uniref:DNA 3'-5' helicase n=1 Tax=Jaapia argillacea MUCL 33604 TaxID=933084 RepID=A0A067PWU4_9AGAM|nr:hypothetical protein JAAARDRAFT_655375 [Jaapia argillacea MUCL 33604]